ncbi:MULTISPECIES: hypothetical protein [Streptomyces]|uniref:NUDIX hydrolase n=1 Tax=Streptomyces evansiae TaxID=3075535 RepID=A0ABU2QZP0_9ACTN|nr:MULTISPECIES: hypothetical protein [unclassified Streptomyces]MDT0409916.1 NUDIX hydrolase [Streptomyces sp. DSM 41979]MYQ59996.1 NUDIX hydrolase [Streptomyces sp. SID4926]SCE40328.1 hypothetical protein GA0115252_146426 [Streptomyces sp. DfronAA-171]
MTSRLTPDLTPLHDLTKAIATTIAETPVRLGSPEGAADLAAAVAVRVAAYVGSVLPTSGRVLGEIAAERAAQDARWGEQAHPDGTGLPIYQHSARRYRDHADRAAASGHLAWRDVLLEEIHEALAESDAARLRAELVQVAAVATAWIEAIDRRTAEAGETK